MGPTALPVHRGGSHSPVGPASGQHLIGLSGRGHTRLQETVHIHTMLDVLSEVEATGGRVNEVIHLGKWDELVKQTDNGDTTQGFIDMGAHRDNSTDSSTCKP